LALTAWLVVRAKMRILALGNKVNHPIQARLHTSDLKERGFTLMELMVVVAIIAIASAGVMFAIQSRASGLAITWRPTEDGFAFEGMPQIKNSKTGEMEDAVKFPKTWLSTGTSVDASSRLALGPEPVIAQQEVVLRQASRRLTLATDGIRPFTIKSSNDVQ
jgi:general secretion pathway protein H